MCDHSREESVAWVVGREEKRDGRRDGLARFNFGPCPGEEIEYGVFVPVYSTGDCGVILQYISCEKMLYERCWRCLTTTGLLELGSLASSGV